MGLTYRHLETQTCNKFLFIQVEAVVRQRDMYRVLLENKGQSPVSVLTQSPWVYEKYFGHVHFPFF